MSKPKKLSLLVAAFAGYVLGARAGRGRYEQIAAAASKVKRNPKVQAAASRAQETVASQAPVVAAVVKDKAASAASTVQDKVTDTFGKDDAPTPHQAAPAGPSVS
jgi:hypothetical protein